MEDAFSLALYIGIPCLLLGFLGQHWMQSKAFSRRNSSGNEEFNTYFSSIILGSGELFRFVKLLGITLVCFALINYAYLHDL